MGARVFAFESNGGECGWTFVSSLRFGSPVDDAAVDVKHRNEMRFATDGIGVGHAGRTGVEVEPADGLSGLVILNGLNPRFGFGGVVRFVDPCGDDAVVIAKREFVFRLSEWSGRIGGSEAGFWQFADGGGVGRKRRGRGEI